jgi:hypothetical protein
MGLNPYRRGEEVPHSPAVVNSGALRAARQVARFFQAIPPKINEKAAKRIR